MTTKQMIEKPALKPNPRRKKPGLRDQLSPELVETLARKGLTLEQISDFCGCTKQNTSYAIRTDEVLKSAWNKGMIDLYSVTTTALLDQISKGNIIAILFTLKSRFGWLEAQHQKTLSADNQPRVLICLPDNERSEEIEA